MDCAYWAFLTGFFFIEKEAGNVRRDRAMTCSKDPKARIKPRMMQPLSYEGAPRVLFKVKTITAFTILVMQMLLLKQNTHFCFPMLT